MADTKTLVEQSVLRFQQPRHRRCVSNDDAGRELAQASEGGKIVGKEEILAYCTRQWGEFGDSETARA